MRRFTNSELTTFMRCRREWYLGYYRALSPKTFNPAGPLATGSRVHEALEAIYTPGHPNPNAAMEALEKAAKRDYELYAQACKEVFSDPSPDDLKAFDKAKELEKIMVEGYLEWLEETGADADITVIAPEQKVTIDSSHLDFSEGEFELMGKLDVRILRHSDERVLFMDHKTVREFTTPVLQLPANMQMKTYHLMEFYSRVNDDAPEVGGAIYNMLRKVKRTASAKPPFYKRQEVWHNSREVETHKMRLFGVIDDILDVTKRIELLEVPHQQVAYANPTNDCYWRCAFFNVCDMFDDGSRVEDMLEANFNVHNPLERYEIVEKEESKSNG